MVKLRKKPREGFLKAVDAKKMEEPLSYPFRKRKRLRLFSSWNVVKLKSEQVLFVRQCTIGERKITGEAFGGANV
jgi:hypothetical protein